MKLAPRIIQAMEILQLPVLALQERIEQEMLSNPVLEMHEDSQEEPASQREGEPEPRGEQMMVVDSDNGHARDFQRLDEFTEEFGSEFPTSDAPPPRPRAAPGERDRKMDAMANTAARGETLTEHLLRQWAFLDVPKDVDQAGRVIISFIDEDGYLRMDLEEMARRSQPPLEAGALQQALPLVQTLEPVGVGARDLQECLLLQLKAEAAAGRDVELETELVRRFLRDIESNRLPQIARRTGRPLEQVKAALENLSRLNPRPGLLIGERVVPVIVPDAIVEVAPDGRVIVRMPEQNTPRLYISRAYRRMARDRATDKKARQFIRRNLSSAQWLLGAIQQRRDTVRRVVQEVFRVQQEFLEDGPEALRPLPMADIAQRVGVHVATVSRAVAGKYVQTPRGIYPLRMFFSGGTTTEGGRDVSWDAVKAKLKEVVDAEDKSSPLSDDQIVEALKARGISIARRTVAKYRKALGIAPARKRRQY